MKTLLAVFVILISSLHSQGEEFTIRQGISVTNVVKALDKHGYTHGSQHALQWAPKKGQDFLFCKLSDEQTLVLTYEIKTKRIVDLTVVTNQTQRKVYPTVKPHKVALSKTAFSLTFKK